MTYSDSRTFFYSKVCRHGCKVIMPNLSERLERARAEIVKANLRTVSLNKLIDGGVFPRREINLASQAESLPQ
jgi:hypothetical protein